MWVTIETDNAGEPSGTPVTNGTSYQRKASTIGNTADWRKFIFPGTVSLGATTKYWIVLHGDYAASNSHYVAWRADTSAASLANGNVSKHTTGGSWAADTDDDFFFRLIESPAGTNYELSSGDVLFESDQLSATYYTTVKDTGASDLYSIKVAIVASGLSDSPLIEIRTSTDGVSFSSWATWYPADYTTRYYQIRVTFTRASLSDYAYLDQLKIVADQLA